MFHAVSISKIKKNKEGNTYNPCVAKFLFVVHVLILLYITVYNLIVTHFI